MFSNINDEVDSPIEMTSKYKIKSDTEDRIMSLAKDFTDEHLVFITENGRLGSLDTETAELVDVVKLDGRVSNAIAQNADGSAFIILTDKGLNKIAYSGGQFNLLWSRGYPTADEFVPRPSGAGSGTSPSIMQLDDGREYIVIADGLSNQNVLVFDLTNGDLMDSHPVVFSGDESSMTEQSIAVKGDRFVVVQNAYSWTADRISQLLESWNVPEQAQNLPYVSKRVQENVMLAPVMMGDSNLGGFIQFKFDPDLPEGERISITWTSERSCPNAIPVVGGSDGLYCVGKVSILNPMEPAEGLGGLWALERQNWLTGELEGTYKLGLNINYNSSYAATQIISDGVMAYGSYGGVVFVNAIQ